MEEFFINRFGAGQFVGESLWIGHLGHFAIILSFVMAGLSALSYAFSEFSKNEIQKNIWQKIGQWSFGIHGFAVISIFTLLFYMIFNHHFEYHYAWKHSSYDLPLKYIVSCFWEGQEGSFLLWQFWHVVLGFILMKTAKKWESPVMMIVALTQFLLGSMVLGAYVLGYKIGVNPFTLLRHEMADAPIFQQANYLAQIKDGNGLNPLLQNYWMVIHPPVLFLGFSSTVVPFAFAIASMIRSEYKEWLKPVLPWALFSAGILGTGILMGGAWAYESLSFGGFWAWDPVENASLVPWLLLVAGLHTLVAYKATNRGLIITYLFLVLTFIFILYSTFLTRSGILGDTSVHAFTDLGMTGQLLIYLFVFLVPSLGLIIYQSRKVPTIKTEEAFLSREFWLFVGALIFLISAVQITYDTSIPVWNTIFGTNIALPAEAVSHYNKVQIIIGIIMAIGAATVQFLSYKTGKINLYFKWLGLSFSLAVIASIVVGFAFEISFLLVYNLGDFSFTFLSTYWLLMLTAFFALFSNILYIILVLKKNVWQWAGSITHIGFGLFLLGILISQGQQNVISLNMMGIGFGETFDAQETQENILLLEGDTLPMGGYLVSYEGRTQEGVNEYFAVKYMKPNEDGEIVEDFYLYPNAQINPQMGLVSNPSTKHYLTKDVFTHVTSIPEGKTEEEELEPAIEEMQLGDTIFTSKNYIIFEEIIANPPSDLDSNYIGLAAKLGLYGFDDYTGELRPQYFVDMRDGVVESSVEKDLKSDIEVEIAAFDPAEQKITLLVNDINESKDFIIMKAIIFPYINVLWIGSILMAIGFFMSMGKRMRSK